MTYYIYLFLNYFFLTFGLSVSTLPSIWRSHEACFRFPLDLGIMIEQEIQELNKVSQRYQEIRDEDFKISRLHVIKKFKIKSSRFQELQVITDL